MKKNNIYISSPDITNYEIDFIKDAFNKNQLSSFGDNINLFENDIDTYLESNVKSVCLNSGSSALHLALILAGVSKGDEVLCQSFTFIASANPIIYQGANPIFIDSETDTWNMCPILLEKAILDRKSKGITPKAIVLVNVYGMPAKMLEICQISKKYNIVLIEDAAEAFGSSYKGKKCGTFGKYGILSFNGNKIITTSGGGALICKTLEDKNKAIYYATQARDEEMFYEHKK